MNDLSQDVKKRPAVFLDRDGVLCQENSYVTKAVDLRIFPYAADCIEQMHKLGYLAICITNQSAVARGLMKEAELKRMHVCLQAETGLDAIYYCPHHPKGNGIYGVICSCRKPDTGLLQRADKEFHIAMEQSYMVGDRASDILCGQKAGLKTILLESGYGSSRLEEDVAADMILPDLRDVVGILKKKSEDFTN